MNVYLHVQVKDFHLQKNINTILHANTLEKETHKYSVFKNTKKSDKMNLTPFNTVESNIPE